MEQGKRRKPTQKEWEAFYGSRDIGSFARVVWPFYFWWMRHEYARAKTPEDIATINATPRATKFWFLCGLVCGAPIVLLITFGMTR